MTNSAAAHSKQPSTARGEATRRKILRAAEQVFGDKGYHAASIAAITAGSGVAQGTFYIYFSSKDEIYRELVRDIGQQLRAAMRKATAAGRNQLERERLGLQGFVSFIAEHPRLYRIVQEAHFVDEQIYRDYYNDIARGYTKVLDAAARSGELAPGNAEVRAWAIMGIGHFLGLRYCLWQGREPSATTFDEVMDLIGHGIAPRDD